jgi:hypothetical protein
VLFFMLMVAAAEVADVLGRDWAVGLLSALKAAYSVRLPHCSLTAVRQGGGVHSAPARGAYVRERGAGPRLRCPPPRAFRRPRPGSGAGGVARGGELDLHRTQGAGSRRRTACAGMGAGPCAGTFCVGYADGCLGWSHRCSSHPSQPDYGGDSLASHTGRALPEGELPS